MYGQVRLPAGHAGGLGLRHGPGVRRRAGNRYNVGSGAVAVAPRALRVLGLVLCVVVAGCSPASQSSEQSRPGPQIPPVPISGHREQLLFASTYEHGGRAVYYNSRDTASTITCTGACTSRWLPLLAPDLRRGFLPFSAKALSYVAGPAGRQVEYDHHPLYLYAGDSSGQSVQGRGNSIDGTWFVVTPALKPGA
jgi:predicted lipoprotein with Yx(FWY)xxD motif